MNPSHHLFILLLLINLAVAQIQINEFMYAPDQGKEWLELHNPSNQTINLSSWTFADENSIDEFSCCSFLENCSFIITANEYLLLLEQDFLFKENFPEETKAICVDDNSLGNGLSNTGETIIITNGSFEDSLTYQKDFGAHKNNKTLEKREDGTWGESITLFGTPGKINSIWLFSEDYSDLEITEFIPNPFDNDDKDKPFGEWVEIYNNGEDTINLRKLIITDEKKENELYIADNKILDEDTILCGGCYIIIYRDGDSDFSLNNNGYDEINLYSEDILLDSLTYSGSTEGMSWSKISNNWYQTEPTPGEENLYQEECDWFLDIEASNSIFQADDFEFSISANRHFGFKQNVTVRGTIEDYHGDIVKEYSPWTNYQITTTGSKQYSPNLAEGIYQLKFWLTNHSCNEANEENNQVTKFIAINPQYKEFSNRLDIEKIYLGSDDKVEWADQFTAKIKVYKGNDTRTSLESWVEKEKEVVSKRSKLNIYDNFNEYTLTIPIQLHPNCAYENGEDGTALLIVEGFGLREEEEFIVEGIDSEVCKEYSSYIKEKEKEELKQKKENAYQIIELPAELEVGEVLRVQVQVWDDDKQGYNAWSYLYRGNKCYSCSNGERESNLIKFDVDENEIKQIHLLVKIDEELEVGEYNLAVNLLKENRKTPIKLREKIHVKDKKINDFFSVERVVNDTLQFFSEKEEIEQENLQMKKRHFEGYEGIIVYESSSAKSKKLIPYFLIFTFLLLSYSLLTSKENSKIIGK